MSPNLDVGKDWAIIIESIAPVAEQEGKKQEDTVANDKKKKDENTFVDYFKAGFKPPEERDEYLHMQRIRRREERAREAATKKRKGPSI